MKYKALYSSTRIFKKNNPSIPKQVKQYCINFTINVKLTGARKKYVQVDLFILLQKHIAVCE